MRTPRVTGRDSKQQQNHVFDSTFWIIITMASVLDATFLVCTGSKTDLRKGFVFGYKHQLCLKVARKLAVARRIEELASSISLFQQRMLGHILHLPQQTPWESSRESTRTEIDR